ncbi:hypothetical protein EDD15DRAFT_2203762 [Pisolithus albus]|nr:hypothetical protein EDD15DRAFT_2203762 [Pisolithus albus]
MPSKVPEDDLRGQLLEVDGVEVVTAEPSHSSPVEGRHEAMYLRRLTGHSKDAKMVEKPEVRNKGELLGMKASVELGVKEAMGDIPAPQSKYLQSPSSPHTDIPPQIPHNEPQDAEDEPGTVEQPDEAVVDALKAPKPLPEPREDPCEVLQHAGSFKIEGWTRSLSVETGGTSPGKISWLTKQVRATALHVKATCPLASLNHNDAAMRIHAPSFYESESCLFEGYESYGDRVQWSEGKVLMLQVKAPCSSGWSTILESTAASSTQKLTKKAPSRVRIPEAVWSGTSSIQGYKAGDRAEVKPRAPPVTQGKTRAFPSCFYVFLTECLKILTLEESRSGELSRSFLEDTSWSSRQTQGIDFCGSPWLRAHGSGTLSRSQAATSNPSSTVLTVSATRFEAEIEVELHNGDLFVHAANWPQGSYEDESTPRVLEYLIQSFKLTLEGAPAEWRHHHDQYKVNCLKDEFELLKAPRVYIETRGPWPSRRGFEPPFELVDQWSCPLVPLDPFEEALTLEPPLDPFDSSPSLLMTLDPFDLASSHLPSPRLDAV